MAQYDIEKGLSRARAAQLFAPVSYWELNPSERQVYCNGCGTKGIGGLLVPNTFWGLNIRPACDIHDWMYKIGKTAEEKEKADRVFLFNLARLILKESRWKWLAVFRLKRAAAYWGAVAVAGGPAFWNGKNDPEYVGGHV